jgi:DNA-binding MarR family transcriptional regulator
LCGSRTKSSIPRRCESGNSRGPVRNSAYSSKAVRLRKLNRVVTNIYNAEFAALGVTASQFNILTALARFRSTSAVTIGRILSLEKSSLSRNLKLMRRHGWIESEGDSRMTEIRISAKGERVYAKALPAWECAQSKCERLLGPEFTERLRSAAEASAGR